MTLRPADGVLAFPQRQNERARQLQTILQEEFDSARLGYGVISITLQTLPVERESGTIPINLYDLTADLRATINWTGWEQKRNALVLYAPSQDAHDTNSILLEAGIIVNTTLYRQMLQTSAEAVRRFNDKPTRLIASAINQPWLQASGWITENFIEGQRVIQGTYTGHRTERPRTKRTFHECGQ